MAKIVRREGTKFDAGSSDLSGLRLPSGSRNCILEAAIGNLVPEYALFEVLEWSLRSGGKSCGVRKVEISPTYGATRVNGVKILVEGPQCSFEELQTHLGRTIDYVTSGNNAPSSSILPVVAPFKAAQVKIYGASQDCELVYRTKDGRIAGEVTSIHSGNTDARKLDKSSNSHAKVRGQYIELLGFPYRAKAMYDFLNARIVDPGERNIEIQIHAKDVASDRTFSVKGLRQSLSKLCGDIQKISGKTATYYSGTLRGPVRRNDQLNQVHLAYGGAVFGIVRTTQGLLEWNRSSAPPNSFLIVDLKEKADGMSIFPLVPHRREHLLAAAKREWGRLMGNQLFK